MHNDMITRGTPAFGETTKIFLIEDMPEQRRVFVRTLKPLGLTILEAGNASEARALMKEENVSLIICDLYLTDIDGFELIKEFKQLEQFRNTPFIVITGSEDEADLKKMLDLGANDFVRKPISIIEFISRVKAQLRLKRYFDEEKRLSEQLKRMNEQLKDMAVRDYLTGIYNRKYCIEYLEKEIHRAVRYNSIFSILLLEIDKFKEFNDTMGYAKGDELLEYFCNIIGKSIRKSDIFGRLEGENFLIILQNTESERIKIVIERIGNIIRQDNYFENNSISISMGSSTYQKGDTGDSIIQRADKILQKQKKKAAVEK